MQATQKYKLADRTVNQEMYTKAASVRKRGGKLFLVTPGLLPGDHDRAKNLDRKANTCGNCDGWGYLGLQMVVGGPFAMPVPVDTEKNHSLIHEDEGWYKVEFSAYPCPVCGLHEVKRIHL